MRVTKHIITTPQEEASQLMGCMGIIVTVGVIAAIYVQVHKIWEHDIPLEQLSISYVDKAGEAPAPDQVELSPIPIENYDDTASGGDTVQTVPNVSGSVRTNYAIGVTIKNDSPYALYSVDYEAELHVCQNQDDEPTECPVADTTSGTFRLDVPPNLTGVGQEKISFSDSPVQGWGHMLIRWTKAAGVKP